MSNSSILTKLQSQAIPAGLKLNYSENVKKLPLIAKYKTLKKKQKISIALVASNLLILLVIVLFIVVLPQTSTLKTSSSITSGSTALSNPLDQLSSANIALTISEAANMPEATPIRNQAESQQAELSEASTSDNVITEPQVLDTSLKSRADIFNYTVKQGDTIASLADKFGITSDSIIWSNHLTNESLTPGQTLVIPPVSGIVYDVKAGDTIASIAKTYGISQDVLVAYNDAEVNGIQTGEQILIPNGQVQATPAEPSWSGATYGYNGYDFGYCTWYVASQISVPANWGNASSWAYYATLSGWNVSSTPTVGSIAQTPYAAGGEGHVAIVVAVNGSQVEIKDMNNYGDGGGWDRVGEGWVSTSEFPNYLTP